MPASHRLVVHAIAGLGEEARGNELSLVESAVPGAEAGRAGQPGALAIQRRQGDLGLPGEQPADHQVTEGYQGAGEYRGFVIDREIFWGQDRLEFVDRKLAG